MQYLGGKTRNAKEIAAIVAPRTLWWEPFCGGLSMSVALSEYGRGLSSDFHPALIALYQAILSGWAPPDSISEEEYKAARSLPDSDPLKAFAGFGCSFGAKYFGGYARSNGRNFAAGAKRTLLRDLAVLRDRGVDLHHASFFDMAPVSSVTLYCDPPYEGTQGYSTGGFDHIRFWSLCQAWVRAGSVVYVSEYNCPVAHTLLWSKKHSLSVAGGCQQEARTEKLFLIS